MIIKASQRANASNLSRHLMNAQDNEHVDLHDLRGFMSDDLHGALKEAEAISKGTRCRQFLFSVSLSPPEGEDVPVEAFEAAIDRLEKELGLEDQPRAIVFHEKEGRRHAHAVYSRINANEMKAVNLPFFKNRLMEVSRELYLEHGWDMPRGMIDHALRNPLSFSREEYQQAKRLGVDPRLVKAMFAEAWRSSDNAESLKAALAEKGFYLARGDRRGVVALDHEGEVYALARWCGVKSKEVKDRLPHAKDLPSVQERRAEIAGFMRGRLRDFEAEIKATHAKQRPAVEFRRTQMVERQRAERKDLAEKHRRRWDQETAARAARLPKGMRGIWSRLTGKYAKIRAQNESEAWGCLLRDRQERDDMISRQLHERRHLQLSIRKQREESAQALLEIRQDIALYLRMERGDVPKIERNAERPDNTRDRIRRRERDRRNDGPRFEPD
jgi:hypothetical protein